MSSKKEVLPTVNIWIELNIGKLEKGQTKENRQVREIRQYLRVGYYRLGTDGSLILDKALDLPTKAFTVDVLGYTGEIINYIRRQPEKVTEVGRLMLDKVAVIPVDFHRKIDWCDGNLAVVCHHGFATHLVRIDGKLEYSSVSVAKVAQAAFDLLVG